MNFNLFDMLEKSGLYDPVVLDTLKYELDQRIYSYGQQFRCPREVISNKQWFRKRLRRLVGNRLKLHKVTRGTKGDLPEGKRILSSAYFTVNEELSKLGFSVVSPPWSGSRESIYLPSVEAFRACEKLWDMLENATFADLLAEPLVHALEIFESASLSAYLNTNVTALVVPNDLNTWERVALRQFREMGRSSFIFLHGLPGRYNRIDDSRSDFLIVWGQKIKENYVKVGHDPDRIFISGHPFYRGLPSNRLRNSLDEILVLTKSMNGAQHSGENILTDRAALVAYLFVVKEVLIAFGVRKVRLRPHPSENSQWYLRFIDPDFFHIDTEVLARSLDRSTLVIGPTSTLLLESLYHGVNYVVFEPIANGRGIDNYPIVPPFDGSDTRVPVADCAQALVSLIKSKTTIALDFWGDYIQSPFDIGFIKDLI